MVYFMLDGFWWVCVVVRFMMWMMMCGFRRLGEKVVDVLFLCCIVYVGILVDWVCFMMMLGVVVGVLMMMVLLGW